MTTPFRRPQNAPFFENVLLTEAKDHVTTNESLSMKILKVFTCVTSKDIAFLIDSGSFLEYVRVYLHSYDLGFYSLFHLENLQTSANYWGG